MSIKIVKKLKENNQDFEWYPTTNEIIESVKKCLESNYDHWQSLSVLDCGAGDGRVLNKLTKGKKYAIEKSTELISLLPSDVFIVGTEFKEQTLIDKSVDVVFCNPPYSEFSEWSQKIIKESHASEIFLVIPERWVKDHNIQNAIKSREAEVTVLGSFDFNNADRKARAKVDIIRVNLAPSKTNRYQKFQKVRPFDLWFDENFSISAEKNEFSKSKTNHEEKIKAELVNGGDLVKVLDQFYQSDMQALMSNYKKIESLDYQLLKELNVDIAKLKESLEQRIIGLKNIYWNELFNNLTKVTERLSTKSRKSILDKLSSQTNIDFTASNVYGVLVWVIKNANQYYDSQLVELVETMTESANIKLYKSNKRTFGDEDWRYGGKPEKLDNYKLDLRVVLHRVGGLISTTWDHERKKYNGLVERSYNLINDVLTIANNIGFDTTDSGRANSHQWTKKSVDFNYYNIKNNQTEILFSVRAFQNGNLHIKFNKDFICRLNVEFGRLKGWLKSKQQAADELDIPVEQVEVSFNSNLKLTNENLLSLTHSN